MTDFLNFLNTAELDTLTKVPGISRQLAGNIIAARPFDFVEDALHVKGMGKNLLGRAQSHFEAELNDSESRAMIPVQEEAAAIEKSQPKAESSARKEPSAFARVVRSILHFVWSVIKVVITLAIGILIGGAIYFWGLPLFNQRIVAPQEQNTSRIQQLSSEVTALNEKIASLQTQLEDVNSRVDVIEKTIEAHSVSLAQLEEMQTRLDDEMKNGNNALALELKREIMFTRSIEYLSRGRLYLSQSNFGLAREDAQSARDLLAQLQGGAPEYQVDALAQVIARLDMALGNLPAFPVIAVDDVDIAWQLLMNGLPESEADIVATFTPLPPPATPTPAAITTFTPTPEATLEATVTP